MKQLFEDEQKLQNEIHDLLTRLVENLELSEEVVEDVTKQFCTIYSHSDFRHSYYKISLKLEEYESDQRDALSAHMDLIREKVHQVLETESESQVNKQVEQKLAKLCDHIKLECLRLSRIDSVQFMGEASKRALTAADGKLQKAEKQADDLQEKVSGFHAQSITILGIFAGLVITFSAVIQFTSSGLTNITNVNASKLCLFVSLTFFFLFNITFLLLYCISKISGNSIAVRCRGRRCDACLDCEGLLKRCSMKYPYIVCFNAVAIIFCVLCFLLA